MSTPIVPCNSCAHLKDQDPGFTCLAYPEGIPIEIATGQHDHRRPFEGDRGIRWEKKPPS